MYALAVNAGPLVAALDLPPRHGQTAYLEVTPQTAGVSRRGFLAASIVGLVSACSKNRKSTPIKVTAYQSERVRQRAALKEYLSRQNVADASKVDKILLREDVLDDPTLLIDLYSSSTTARIINRRDDPLTLCNVKFDEHGEVRRSSIIVLIPAARLPLIYGSESERTTFDSMFYHEVEGHGTDHADGSEFFKLLAGVYQFTGYQQQRVAAATPLLDTALEFSAFIKELDRLIVKLGFHQNPQVIEPWAKETIERELAQHAITFLKLLNESSQDPDGVHASNFLGLFNRFWEMRFHSVASETREYTVQLIRGQGWKKPIPW